MGPGRLSAKGTCGGIRGELSARGQLDTRCSTELSLRRLGGACPRSPSRSELGTEPRCPEPQARARAAPSRGRSPAGDPQARPLPTRFSSPVVRGAGPPGREGEPLPGHTRVSGAESGPPCGHRTWNPSPPPVPQLLAWLGSSGSPLPRLQPCCPPGPPRPLPIPVLPNSPSPMGARDPGGGGRHLDESSQPLPPRFLGQQQGCSWGGIGPGAEGA